MSRPVSSAADLAVTTAYEYLGLPYVFFGGDLQGPAGGGFDRAGFTRRVVFVATGIDIGQTLDGQLRNCAPLGAGEAARPGDVLFWVDPSNPMQKCYHQAFYTGFLTVIASIPKVLAEPGAAFELRHSRAIQGAVFHEQTIDISLLTAQAERSDNQPHLVIARPPYTSPLGYRTPSWARDS
ncbi:peptidoglycan endopeptidase [Mycobacteroides salmoniphilum]|uniref:peptidoglycan endopeptidase n=1 Tax=Mycobacteroides salmoniphilum TaxID=404941 RepID=UPI003567FDEE